MPLNQQQIQRLREMGLSTSQMAQVVRSAGGIQQNKTGLGFAGNVVKSTGRLIGDTAGALVNVLNPDMEKNTVANLGRLGASIVSLFLPGEQGNEEIARNIGKFYADRYGGLDKAWNTLYNDPAGVAADLSVVLGGGATALKAGGLTKASNIASKASRLTDPLNIIGKTATAGVNGLFRKVGTGMENASSKVLVKGLGSTKKLDDLAERAGTTREALIEKYNLGNRNPSLASKAKKFAVNKADELTLASNKNIPVSDFIIPIDQEISRLSDIPIEAMDDATVSQIKELQRQKNAIVAMAGGEDFLTPDKTLRYRKEIKVPKSEFGLNPKGVGRATAKKSVRDVFRRKINELDPNIAQYNLDYGALKEMEQAFKRYQSRSSGKSPISFGGVTKAGVGSIVAGVPGAIAGYALDTITNDPRFLTASSKTLKKVGGAVKEAKLPKVPKYANTAFKAAKVTRVLNPQGLSKQPKKSQTRQGVSVQKVALAPQKQTISRSGSYPSVSNPKITPFKLKIKR